MFILNRPLRKIRRVVSKRRLSTLENKVLESQWLKEDQLYELQIFYVRKLLKHAYQTTRYYRELFDSIGLQVKDVRSLSDYAELVPVLDKNIIRERFEDIISPKWRDKYTVLQTSGSTGSPTKFVHPRRYPIHRIMWTMVDDLCGLKGGERTLMLWGGDLGDDHYRVFDEKQNLYRFSFYHMPPEGFEELLNLIVQWRPEFIYGYVSLVYTVAEALEQRGYSSLGVKIIQTHAESLYNFQREKIEKIFGGRVFEHYGSGEIYHLGVECKEHDGIHLFNNLRLFELEPIDDRGSNTGEVLITDFHNYAMPFLRYRIGDVLTIDNKPCRCGRSLPRAIVEGRTWDMIFLRDGSIVSPVFFSKLIDVKQVERFLIHQRTYNRIDVHIVPTASFVNDYRDYLIREIKGRTKIEDIRMFLKKEIDVIVAGKHRVVRSDVSVQVADMGQSTG